MPLRRAHRRPNAPGDAAALWLVPAPLLFAVIFSLVWISHAPWLRLPYFWDEAGYFIPAARDLLLTGNPVPVSTLSNAHPPLVMAWLAFWWKFSAYTPAVTRTAMLLVAAFALLGVFRLARQVSNVSVALAATLLTMLYPVFFAQSSLGHLDMMAAAFTLWGLSSYLGDHSSAESPSRPHGGPSIRATVWFALAGLAKETALLAAAALYLWELVCPTIARDSKDAICKRDSTTSVVSRASRGLPLLASFLPLAGWLAYHYVRTGFVFGNPEYFRYNMGATLHPLRTVVALAQRIWQLFGYLNMFVLTGAAALAMRNPPLPIATASGDDEGAERPRIALNTQLTFGAVIVAYLLALSLVGGAVLARYLLPVYPLVIIEGVATLWRRVSWWKVAVGMIGVAFLAGLFVYPPYRFAPEDNLAYADYIRLHKTAEAEVARYPNARVLTAWPATDELRKPYLGYVKQAVKVVPIENFTVAELTAAHRRMNGQFDYTLLFSTKYEPAHQFRGWWEELQTRYFDYHRDATPAAAAEILGGHIAFFEQRGGEWVAIIRMPGTSPP